MFDFSKKDKNNVLKVVDELAVIAKEKNMGVLEYMDDLDNADIVCSKLYPAMPKMMKAVVKADKFKEIYKVHKNTIINNIKQKMK